MLVSGTIWFNFWRDKHSRMEKQRRENREKIYAKIENRYTLCISNNFKVHEM